MAADLFWSSAPFVFSSLPITRVKTMNKTADKLNNTAHTLVIPPPFAMAPQKSGPSLYGARHYRMTGDGMPRPICVATWLFEVFIEGQTDISIARTDWKKFEPGRAVLYSPKTLFQEGPLGSRVCRSISVFFDLGTSKLFSPWRNAPLGFWVIEDPTQKTLVHAEKIAQYSKAGGVGDLLALSSLCQLLALLLQTTSHDGIIPVEKQWVSQEDMVTKAKRFMKENIHRSIQVEDIARHVNMSQSGLAHAYRRLTGISPMDDLRIMRIDAAKILLLHGRYSLEQIAEETGFADASHLSRTFRRITGLNTMEYRRCQDKDG